MRKSFVRLVVRSVLLSWALIFVVAVSFALSRTWSESDAREDGIFLIHALLEEIDPEKRSHRLGALQADTWVPLQLVSIEYVEREIGRGVRAGERVHHDPRPREEWYFLVFLDGRGALAAGPVNPAMPHGFFRVRALGALLMIPLIIGGVALRLEHSISKVERASDALAIGELGARVEERTGPSEELAVRFNAMAERVEKLVRSRDELVQAVSHELGSPLSRLRFHLELLEGDSQDAREERVAAMSRDLDALDELVAELLGYVQSADLEVQYRSFEPTRILEDLAELARLEASEERAVTVVIEPGVSVVADPRLFQRAVENVLRNAVRHAASEVRVELRQVSGDVYVAVHDDGPGISADLRAEVMKPFFRASTARDRRTGGTGLGLAIVARILERHGGAVEIDDSPLGGAVVTTVWPR